MSEKTYYYRAYRNMSAIAATVSVPRDAPCGRWHLGHLCDAANLPLCLACTIDHPEFEPRQNCPHLADTIRSSSRQHARLGLRRPGFVARSVVQFFFPCQLRARGPRRHAKLSFHSLRTQSHCRTWKRTLVMDSAWIATCTEGKRATSAQSALMISKSI